MTEEQDKPKAAASDSEGQEAEAADTPVTSQPSESAGTQPERDSRKPGRGVAGVALLIFALFALAAVAVSLYSLYELRDLHARQTLLAEQQSELGEAVTGVEAAREQLASDLADLEASQAETLRALEELRAREKMDNLDWALAEVEYLTIIAVERLTLTREPEIARAALEAAARRLKDIDHPGLIPVREQYTADINALKAVPEVDVAGMALYLADLITRAEQLPLATDAVADSEPAPAAAEEPPVAGWREFLNAIWEELKQLVVIQREDAPPPALMAPDERYYLYQNLRTELASARAAVLRRDTANLRASIGLVTDWLRRYFDTDAAEVRNMIEALEQMAQRDLAPPLPDVSSSLESLRAFERRAADGGGGADR